jgi:hypothetical protein
MQCLGFDQLRCALKQTVQRLWSSGVTPCSLVTVISEECVVSKDWQTEGSSDMLAPVNKIKCHFPQDYSLDIHVQVKNINVVFKWDSTEHNMLHTTEYLIPSNVK